MPSVLTLIAILLREGGGGGLLKLSPPDGEGLLERLR